MKLELGEKTGGAGRRAKAFQSLRNNQPMQCRESTAGVCGNPEILLEHAFMVFPHITLMQGCQLQSKAKRSCFWNLLRF